MYNLGLLLKLHLEDELRLSCVRQEKNIGRKIGFLLKHVVQLFLCVMLYLLCRQLALQLLAWGWKDAIPVIGYSVGSVMTLVCTVLKINEILAGKSDAEFVMSLPMSTVLHVLCIFLRLYIYNTLLVMLVNVPMILVYASATLVPDNFWPGWCAGVALNCMPMTGIAALVGTVMALCLVTLRKSNLIHSILTLILMGGVAALCFHMIFAVQKVFMAAGDGAEVIRVIATNFKAGRLYQKGIIGHEPGAMLLFVIYSVVWFLFFFFLMSMSYQEVILALRAPKDFVDYDYGLQKEQPLQKAMEKRIWEQWLQSKSYMRWTLLGPMIACISGVFLLLQKKGAVLFSDQMTWQQMVLALGILCSLIAMGCSSYCGYSMEGKRRWIMQTIPVEEKQWQKFYRKKNLWITVPVAALAGSMWGMALSPQGMEALLFVILPVLYAWGSAVWGAWVDARFCDFSLEGENQILWQSTSFYLGWLPVVLLPLALGVGFMLL